MQEGEVQTSGPRTGTAESKTDCDVDVRTLSKIDLLERQLAEIKALLASQQQIQLHPHSSVTPLSNHGAITPHSSSSSIPALPAPAVGGRPALPRLSSVHTLHIAMTTTTVDASTPCRPKMSDVLAAAKTLQLRKVDAPSDTSRAAAVAANSGLSGALRAAMEKRFKVLQNRIVSSPSNSDTSDSVFGSPESDHELISNSVAANRTSLGRSARHSQPHASLGRRVGRNNVRLSGAAAPSPLTPFPQDGVEMQKSTLVGVSSSVSSGTLVASAPLAHYNKDEPAFAEDTSLALSSDSECETSVKCKGDKRERAVDPPAAGPPAATFRPPSMLMSPAAMLGEVRGFNRSALRTATVHAGDSGVSKLPPTAIRGNAALSPSRKLANVSGAASEAAAGVSARKGINFGAMQAVSLRKTGMALPT